jgi:hypothetical protein
LTPGSRWPIDSAQVAAVSSALAVAIAGALVSVSLDQGRSVFATGYLWASLGASLPVALLIVLLVRRKSPVVLPTIGGMLMAAAALALEGGRAAAAVDPLLAGLTGVLGVGLLMRASGRIRVVAIAQAVVVAYLAIAFIYEATISLHNV